MKQFKQAVAELDVTNKDKVQTLFKKIDVDGNGSGKVSKTNKNCPLSLTSLQS